MTASIDSVQQHTERTTESIQETTTFVTGGRGAADTANELLGEVVTAILGEWFPVQEYVGGKLKQIRSRNTLSG